MASFKPPTKKKHKGANKISIPLPIPISNLTKEKAISRWCYYHGVLEDDHVHVEKSGDVFDLLNQGYFGKLISILTSKKLVETDHESACNQVTQVEDEKNVDTDTVCDKIIETNDPCDSVSKTLHLSFCESFFLSYGLGCLFVNSDKSDLTLSQQWKHFCSKFPRFPINYAAYHHFRSKGWVPKDGIRYGADFLLYRKGPPFFHASYIVAICCVNAKSLEPASIKGIAERHFTWETMTGLLRLATTVSKEIMLCYVAIPEHLTTSNISLKDIQSFSIYENIVSRWVSSKEREKELLDVDCDY